MGLNFRGVLTFLEQKYLKAKKVAFNFCGNGITSEIDLFNPQGQRKQTQFFMTKVLYSNLYRLRTYVGNIYQDKIHC